MRTVRFTLLLAIAGATSQAADGEDWPAWRGPRGDGSSHETNVPTQWDGVSGKNIIWKTAIPGRGYSSPIVSRDVVFVTACDEERQTRVLHCLNRNAGELRW